jgi:hypothetical protein
VPAKRCVRRGSLGGERERQMADEHLRLRAQRRPTRSAVATGSS